MKKLLCLVLTVFLLAGLTALPASAVDPADNNYYIGESNGYEIWLIDPVPEPAETVERIGDYLFECGSVLGGLLTTPTAIYAVKNEEMIYLKQAYEQGLIDIDQVAGMVDRYSYNGIETFYVSLFGDINYNKKLEVADAVMIQKIIAKSLEMDYLADMNDDGEINLEDVVLLQKKIAKIV